MGENRQVYRDRRRFIPCYPLYHCATRLLNELAYTLILNESPRAQYKHQPRSRATPHRGPHERANTFTTARPHRKPKHPFPPPLRAHHRMSKRIRPRAHLSSVSGTPRRRESAHCCCEHAVRISVPLSEAPGQPAVRLCRLDWRASELNPKQAPAPEEIPDAEHELVIERVDR